MIFTRLEMMRFKRFKHAQVAFKPGLNVIKGPNEAGKSTLRSALLAALFGNPTSESVATQAWTTWGEAERCELRLEYRDRLGETCQLRKDFADGKIFLIKASETFRTAKTIQAMLTEDLGIPNENFYELCGSLDVRSLANLGNVASRKEIGKMISGLMSGAGQGQDCEAVLRKLEAGLSDLNKGLKSPSKTPGPLKAGRDRLALLTGQRAEAERKWAERRQKISEYEAVAELLENHRQRLGDLEHLLEANARLGASQKRRAELLEQDSHFDRQQELRKALEKEREQVDQALAQAPAAVCTAEQIAELQQLQQNLRQPDPEAVAPTKPGQLWLVLTMVSLALSLVGWLHSWQLFSLLFGAAVLFGILAWRQRKAWQARLDEHGRAAGQRAQARADCQQRLQEISKPTGATAETLVANWPQAQALLARQAALQGQWERLPAVDQERWREIRRELRLVEDVLSDPALAPLRLEPQALAERQREAQQLSRQAAEVGDRHAGLKAWLSQDAGSTDALNSVEEELAELKENLLQLEQREKVLRLTQTFLEQARRAALNPAREVLEHTAGEWFRRMSRGRYEKVMVNDEDLSSRVYCAESRKWEEPAVLSQGTFDQFYLSLRLALSDILSAGKQPPLLLDEPFAAFDAGRLEAALAALRSLAEGRQILLFTCRDDYDRAADHLIALEGPAQA